MQPELRECLRKLAFTPSLLVGCDYDGTLAEIVPEPEQAFPDWRALLALRVVGELPSTAIAVVSGRSLRDLNTFLGETGKEMRVGSHGAEWGVSNIHLTPEQAERHSHITRALTHLAQETRGLHCEIKPASIALHVRVPNRRIAAATIAAAVESFGNIPGVFVKHGIHVVEFMVVRADKGEAVLRARRATHATGVLFIGDDITDEDVFRSLGDIDVGIRVGKGKTHANHRIADLAGVTMVLQELANMRCEWALGRQETH